MVRSLADGMAGLLPDELGAREAARFLATAGTSMSPFAALAALLPASLYGEGLVRAFDRFSPRDTRRLSARGRIGSLVVVAASPVLLLGGLSAANALTQVLGDSLLDRLLGRLLRLPGALVDDLARSSPSPTARCRSSARAAGRWCGAPPGPARSSPAPASASCCSCRSASTSAGRTAARPTSPPRRPASAGCSCCTSWSSSATSPRSRWRRARAIRCAPPVEQVEVATPA